jgi:hypothetical protein
LGRVVDLHRLAFFLVAPRPHDYLARRGNSPVFGSAGRPAQPSNDASVCRASEHPEQAFIFLEERFREECDNALRHAEQQNDRADVYDVRYISNVIAAIEVLEIQAPFEREVPSIRDMSYETYLQFSNDVEHYKTKLRVRHARRTQGYSVRFDHAAKQKLRHYLNEMVPCEQAAARHRRTCRGTGASTVTCSAMSKVITSRMARLIT